ncbi:uncharacterized protein [Diadema antillarum]|uniref:uncharacterized protein n=1 Tax=Diadema antillarum TaxID=105358 RepID=UPI003A88A399
MICDYRDCIPSREVLRELARQIHPSKAGQLCVVLGIKLEQPGAHCENDVLELLVRWVEQGKEIWTLDNRMNKFASKRGAHQEVKRQLSDKVYDAGFVDLAAEIMTGIKYGKVTQLTTT